MRYILELEQNNGYQWIKEKNLSYKGNIFDSKNNLLNTKEILSLFISCSSMSDFKDKIQNISGLFTIIVISRSSVFIASDLTRTFPIFIKKDHDLWIIRDNVKGLGNKDINLNSYKEFISSGYVCGNKTLLNGLYQLQSAEVIEIKKSIINREFYWTYATNSYWDKSFSDLENELLSTYEKVIDKIITSAKNKTIVIPLSGGYDSRLIATLLKRRAHNNVICFTYGRRKCFEANISKKVSEKLGYEWIFIEYTDQLIETYLKIGGVWDEYVGYANNLVSIPHIADFIAVSEMHNRNLIPEDSIIVPGHSGDIFAGTHIPKNLSSISSKIDIENALMTKHFRYDVDNKGINIDVVLEDKKLHSIFEEYSWKERQTKFIINSVRCYEFYGYKYLVPLWDKDLASFFRKVNLKHKNRNSTIKFSRETNLYDKVSKGYFIEYNVDFNRNSFKNIIQRILCKLLQICKNKDCLNYNHQIKILDKTSKPYEHINNAVIKNTLRNLKLQ